MAAGVTSRVFTAVEPTTPERGDNWGVINATFAGQARVVPIKGTWPCKAASVLPGMAFRATLREGQWKGKRQWESVGTIEAVEKEQFAVLQQVSSLNGGRLKASMKTLLNNMNRAYPHDTQLALTETMKAIKENPVSVGEDPLILRDRGNLRATTAADIRAAYKAVEPRVVLQARFVSLPTDMVDKLPVEMCDSIAADPYLICKALVSSFSRTRLLSVADRIARGERLAHDMPSRIHHHLAQALETVSATTGSFWMMEADLITHAATTLAKEWQCYSGYNGPVRSALTDEGFLELVEVEDDGAGTRLLALKEYAELERSTATLLASLVQRTKTGPPYPRALAMMERLLVSRRTDNAAEHQALRSLKHIWKDPTQLEALRCLLGNWLAVVTGRAGACYAFVSNPFPILYSLSRTSSG